MFVQFVFAEIHCVLGNVVQPPLGAITVAGPGEEKFVVPGGAAISDQIGSLLPIAFCPLEMITEIGSPQVGVPVGLLVAVRVEVLVTVTVAVGVGARVGV